MPMQKGYKVEEEMINKDSPVVPRDKELRKKAAVKKLKKKKK